MFEDGDELNNVQQRQAVKQFVADWTGRGDEKQDAQNFWRQLLQKVFGVDDPGKAISFEYRVKNDQTNTTIFMVCRKASKMVPPSSPIGNVTATIQVRMEH